MAEMTALRVDPTNAEQLRAWDGDEGEHWATHADRYDAALRHYQPSLMAATGIAPADRVLDIGCGAGQATLDAARLASSGSAVGVDLSSRMLAVARARSAASGVRNATFEQADAQIHPFATASFDVALSRTGAMFFGDPTAAFANIARALRPGGRLVLLAWQGPDGNEWIRSFVSALAAGRDVAPPSPDRPGPFSLSRPDPVRALLTTAGFDAPAVEGVERPMYFGPDVPSAHQFLLGQLGWMLEGLDDRQRADSVSALRETLEAHRTTDGVTFRSATWLVTARRSA